MIKLCRIVMALINVSEYDFHKCGIPKIEYKLLKIAMNKIEASSESDINAGEWVANKNLLVEVLSKLT